MKSKNTNSTVDKLRPNKRVSLTFTQPSLTKQSFKDESNINHIMAKYEKTGLLTHLNKKVPTYGDFSKTNTSYQEALNEIKKAEIAFNQLPVAVRQKFNYDAGLFLDFAQNPENIDTMRDMGLAKPKPIPEATPEEKPLKTQNIPSEKNTEEK